MNKKPIGYFKNILAIDCETTGINFNDDDPSKGQQALSWGIIVADGVTLKPIEELYVEIKYNNESLLAKKNDLSFGTEASNIHGLTLRYLEKNAMDEKDAVVLMANLIIKYWGPNTIIKTLGHNVHLFDLAFLRSMFRRYDINLPFGSRHYDTSSLGFLTIGSYNSNDLFSTMGFLDREKHNALDDIKMTLESARRIKLLWNAKVGVKAYE